MAFGRDVFNKFAKVSNSINQGINQVIGKEVIKGEVREIEAPREFPPYNSYPSYIVAEPEQWLPVKGVAKQFTLEGHTLLVSDNLDACIQYRKSFITTAEYYTEQFKFKYCNCVQDFDTLVHYFEDIYIESLMPMIQRSYSLLLPFGIFTADIETFLSHHLDTYKVAITSYETMVGIEISKNQAAENMGGKVGGAMRLQGGGFGVKGAAKGIAQAEAFNFGMGLIGKCITSQTKMTQEEKANAYAAFKHDIFFQEVYSDYVNTFLTFVETLSKNGLLGDITTSVGTKYDTMFKNLQNPMFPQDKVAPALITLICANPFVPSCFNLLRDKFGQTYEVNKIIAYFVD